MRFSLISFLFFLGWFSPIFAQYNCSIQGRILNAESQKIKINLTSSYLPYYIEENEITTDVSGFFQLNINVKKPTEAALVIRDEYFPLYLEPNFNLVFNTDMEGFDNSLVITGNGSNENNFNKLFYSQFEDPALAVVNTALRRDNNADDFCKIMLQKRNDKFEFLENYRRANSLSNQFYQLKKNEIEYQYGIDLIKYFEENARLNNLSKPVEPSFFIDSAIKKISVQNEAASSQRHYTEFCFLYNKYEYNKILQRDKRFYLPYESYQNAKKIFVGKTLQAVQFQIIDEQFSQRNHNAVETIYNEFITTCNHTDMKNYLQEKHEFANIISKGKPAPNFSLIDIAGNTISLEKFKGKVLYIDFWASWCYPCIEQIKPMQVLETEYAGKPIEFIKINVDENKQNWFIASDKYHVRNENNFYSPRSFQGEAAKGFDVGSIPAFFIIDQNFKIIAKNAEKPSSTKIRTLLNELINP